MRSEIEHNSKRGTFTSFRMEHCQYLRDPWRGCYYYALYSAGANDQDRLCGSKTSFLIKLACLSDSLWVLRRLSSVQLLSLPLCLRLLAAVSVPLKCNVSPSLQTSGLRSFIDHLPLSCNQFCPFSLILIVPVYKVLLLVMSLIFQSTNPQMLTDVPSVPDVLLDTCREHAKKKKKIHGASCPGWAALAQCFSSFLLWLSCYL